MGERRFTGVGLRRLGSFLRASREAKSWSVQELSQQTKQLEDQFYALQGEPLPKVVGVSIAAISRIENGYI